MKNLNTEFRQPNRQARRFKKPTKHCSRCNRLTHNNDECWLLHPELRNNNRRPRNRSLMTNTMITKQATNDDDDTSSYTRYHTTTRNDTHRTDYLIDSGENTSMDNNTSILHDYQEFDSVLPISSSNGETSPAYGKDKLKMNRHVKIVIDNDFIRKKEKKKNGK
jgi:hypothetical protein